MGRTLGLLCADLAKAMGEQVLGTPSGGGQSSFISTPLTRRSDGYYDDWYGRFYDGKHRDTSFDVSSFNGDNGQVDFIPALDEEEAVDTTDLFYLSMEFEAEELIASMNSALDMVGTLALEDFFDETLLIVANVYEYNLPPKFQHLESVYHESANAGRFSSQDDPLPYRHWDILRGPSPKLWLDDNYVNLTTGRKLRLVGQKRPDRLVLDADVCNVNPTFMVQQAKAFLHQSRIRGEGADAEEHRTQMLLAQSMAEGLLDRISITPRGRDI